MAKLVVGCPDMMREFLELNGIDVDRCTSATIESNVGEPAFITVTMIAKTGPPPAKPVEAVITDCGWVIELDG